VNKVLTAGKHNLEYIWLGPSPDQAPTIIFLHEGLGCVGMWKDFPERVAAATGFGALVYSRAGYGNSDPIELPRPITFMHDEALTVLPQVISTLQIREAILFGHSDGGSIALIHAGSDSAKNVRALILEAPHVFVEDLSIESITLAKENYESGSLRQGLAPYHGDNVDCAFRGWNDVWLNPQFRSWNIESYLPSITAPVLVIQGEDDQYGTIKQVEAIERGSSGIVVTTLLSDCGHSPHRDQPEQVIESVIKFLGKFY
jgi:pimeloyl-ACP methyl ester carboxylesterase